jgi:hypothetical protein
MFFRTTLATAIACGLAFGSTQAALALGPHPRQPVHNAGGRITPNPGGVKPGKTPLGGGRNFGTMHGPQPVHSLGGRISPYPGGARPGKTPLGGGGVRYGAAGIGPLGGGGRHPSR